MTSLLRTRDLGRHRILILTLLCGAVALHLAAAMIDIRQFALSGGESLTDIIQVAEVFTGFAAGLLLRW